MFIEYDESVINLDKCLRFNICLNEIYFILHSYDNCEQIRDSFYVMEFNSNELAEKAYKAIIDGITLGSIMVNLDCYHA